MAAAKESAGLEITVMELKTGRVMCFVKGTSPLIFNRMAEKARRELLLPKGRKTAADRAQSLKHNPLEEYRNSVYRRRDDGPTRLVFPAPGFKGAICTAALEVPGMRKAQIGRLTWVEGYSVDVYGVPQILMSVVRSADMNHTPDIRTRAILPEWVAAVPIRYTRPQLTGQGIVTLLAAAGMIVGVGDFRQEKAKGNFGQFTITTEDDPDVQRIMREQGREPQDAALANPEPYDVDTEDLYRWYGEEIDRRGRRDAA